MRKRKEAHMKEIEKLVRSLGIGATYRGYKYLCHAVFLCLQDEDYLLGVSKSLYPKIAAAYQATYCSVERDLRTVISVCWERGNRQLLDFIALYPLESKPTTGEFIDILTGYVKQHLV